MLDLFPGALIITQFPDGWITKLPGVTVSAIKQALKKLNGSIGKLEDSVGGLETSMAGKQRDMFSAPSNQNGAAKKNGQIDTGLFARRLDKAIESVEAMLQEGKGN
jgi:hypothetical protein